MNNLKIALQHASKGRYVFPLVVNGKLPIVKDWESKATLSRTKIKKWWSKHPDANIAIATGPSKLFVVDVDTKGDKVGKKSFKKLQRSNKQLPETYTVETASGGRHYFFNSEDFGLRNSSGLLGKDIDTRADGGYVVAAGSTIDGVRYKPVVKSVVNSLPIWLRTIASNVKSRAIDRAEDIDSLDAPANVQAVKIFLENDADIAIEGEGGDATTYQVACEVRDLGVSADMALELMDDYWNINCIPAWDLKDLQSKIRNAYNYSQNDIGHNSPIEDFGNLPIPEFTLRAEKRQKEKRRSLIVSQAELLSMPPINWLVKNVFPSKAMSVIYGLPNCGKSFLALDLGFRIAHEMSWHGDVKMKSGAVLYVAGEGLGGMPARLRAWLKYHNREEEEAPFYTFNGAVDLADKAGRDQFKQAVEESIDQPVKLIIFDTLARCMTGDENSSQDMGAFIRGCDYIKEKFNTHVMLVHHSGKDTSRGARGSNSLDGATDTSIHIEKEDDGMAIYMHKQKDAEFMKPFYTKMNIVDVGVDEDGEPVSSIALEAIDRQLGEDEAETFNRLIKERILEVLRSRAEPTSVTAIAKDLLDDHKHEYNFKKTTMQSKVRDALNDDDFPPWKMNGPDRWELDE